MDADELLDALCEVGLIDLPYHNDPANHRIKGFDFIGPRPKSAYNLLQEVRAGYLPKAELFLSLYNVNDWGDDYLESHHHAKKRAVALFGCICSQCNSFRAERLT